MSWRGPVHIHGTWDRLSARIALRPFRIRACGISCISRWDPLRAFPMQLLPPRLLRLSSNLNIFRHISNYEAQLCLMLSAVRERTLLGFVLCVRSLNYLVEGVVSLRQLGRFSRKIIWCKFVLSSTLLVFCCRCCYPGKLNRRSEIFHTFIVHFFGLLIRPYTRDPAPQSLECR